MAYCKGTVPLLCELVISSECLVINLWALSGNAQVFFVVWWLSAFWFSAWVLNKGRVHNWFRMPCDLPHATFVYVWAPDQHGVLSVNVSFIVHVLRKIRVCSLS